LIDREHLKELEPAVAGVRAIHVPESGIVNYKQVCSRLAERIQERDGRIITGARVTRMRLQSNQVILQTEADDFAFDHVVNCAGLHSDRVAAMTGSRPNLKIVPFRGEYFEVKPQAQHLCRNLIYPVPDPNFPFLGVHFTRMIKGGVECGPNAVLAFAREGYTKADINLADLAETLTYSGFLRLAAKYWQTGMGEMWRSFSKAAFVRALQHLVPAIREDDLEAAPAGVRAQAIAPDGAMVDDFMIHETERVVSVCNAPSPAATASLNIGRLIVDKLAARF
jgi:L-2-hydroxyglutarate oxidase